MRRREFIAGMAGVAAWPLVARAQQPKLVGLLNAVSFDGAYAVPAEAIRQGLREVGFIEGTNLTIEYRSADSHYDRLPDLAADLVRNQVAAIVAIGASAPALAATKAAAGSVPIVFADGADAVEVGVLKSGDAPEGNATAAGAATGLALKRLEIILELVRRNVGIGYLDNSKAAGAFDMNVESITAAARDRGRQVSVFDIGTEREIETAFTSMALQGVRALIVSPDPYLTTRQAQTIELAAQSRIATIYAARAAVALGGLMSYGIVSHDIYRLAGIYAGRILDGAAPADTPIMIPIRHELVINNSTAKALRVAMPRRLLIRADEVID